MPTKKKGKERGPGLGERVYDLELTTEDTCGLVADLSQKIELLEGRLETLCQNNHCSHESFARRIGEIERLVKQPTLYVNPWEPKPSRLQGLWASVKQLFGFGGQKP